MAGSPTAALVAILAVGACADTSGVGRDPPPRVSGVVLAWDGSEVTYPGAHVFAAGDTIRLVVDVRDNRRVRWVGIHLVEPFDAADSVEITDSSAAVGLGVEIFTGPTLVGLLRINGFARDDLGQRVEWELRGNPASVYRSVSRGMPVVLDAAVRDVAFDLKRDRAYLSQPDSARIAVFSLSAAGFGPPLVPPVAPAGLDLSASGDSLLVALPAIRKLGVLDLTAASPTWSMLDLVFDTSLGRHPDKVRVSAANKVLISITATGYTGAVGQVVEYDIGSQSQRLRMDVSYSGGYPGVVTDATLTARSSDRSRILFLFDNSCCPEEGQVYVSATDTFLPRQPTVQAYGPSISANASGQVFLVGRTVFNSTLTIPMSYYPPGAPWPSAISQGGDTAYFTVGTGFLRSRLPDGVSLERVLLPETPLGIFSVPGAAERVFAVTATTVTLANLGTTVANLGTTVSTATPPGQHWFAFVPVHDVQHHGTSTP